MILYALAGSLLALATEGEQQGIIATMTGTGVALVLGAAWPVHRGFPIAGAALGLLLLATPLIYLSIWLLLHYDHPAYSHDRAGHLLGAFAVSLTMYGAWTFLMTVGAGVTWLAKSLLHSRVPAIS